MNRKLLNGLLLLSVVGGTVGTFTSCKDTEDGLRNELLVGQQSMSDLVSRIRKVTDGEFRDSLNNWLDEQIRLASEGNDYQYDDLRDLVWTVSYLQGSVNALDKRVDDLTDSVDNLTQYVYGDLTTRVENLEIWQVTVNDSLASLYAQGVANAEAIRAIQETLSRYDSALQFMNQQVTNLASQYKGLLDSLTTVNARLDGMENQIRDLNTDMAKVFSFLANKFAKFVTSIPVHQTYNPIFGTVNLPIGLQTNLVGTYYYYADVDVTFPVTNTKAREYWPGNPALTEETLEHVAAISSPVTLGGNQYIVEDGDNNMGEIYLSVNPASVNADGWKVSLVNSQDEEILKASDLHIYKDDTQLTFGVTRADNGAIYRLPVRLEGNASDISQIAFDLKNKGELASAFKAAVSNHGISDIAHLGKLLYDQLDGFLPAYAVKISWEDEEIDANGNVTPITNAVYSNFNIAATTLHPLSFATGYGFSANKHLPKIDPITEYIQRIRDIVKEAFDQFDIHGVNISMENAKIDFSDDELTIAIDLGGLPVTNSAGTQIGTIKPGTIIYLTNNGLGGYESAGDLSDFLNGIADSVNASIDEIGADLQAQVDDLVDQINANLESLYAFIDGKFANIQNKIENNNSGMLRYADKLIDLYNKLAARINTLLDDPNHYLQVFMAYNAGDGLHHLSNNVMSPTVFKCASGDAIELYATSYNAELIVPAFKKYVAITNVYYPKGIAVDKPMLIPGGGFDLAALNKAAGLNEVLPGRQQRVAINVSNTKYFQPGYIYEVYYTAIDYRGYTSTQKYFITIKN